MIKLLREELGYLHNKIVTLEVKKAREELTKYLSTSSFPSQSSVVFLEVESCFYLVIPVSFSTGG